MKIILSGGGTGGHVYPALAIADALKKEYPRAEFLYVGVRGRAEEQIVPALGYKIRYVHGAGFSGNRYGPGNLVAVTHLGLGLVQAMVILLGFKPALVIGTGGYASVPAVLAAVLLRKFGRLDCRIFIHEQNYAPGRWNRLISRWVDRVWVSFEGTRRFFNTARVEYTGYPLREQIIPQDRDPARRNLGVEAKARVLLVFGGSQGAKTINRALVEALPQLLADPDLEVFHGFGALNSRAYEADKDTRTRVKALGLATEQLSRYHAAAFFHDIQTYYAAADLVICRGGAGTINEICRCGRPALIIPKSNLAGEHQVINSLTLARKGAAEVILERPELVNGHPEARVNGQVLAATALRLLRDKNALAAMSKAALGLNIRANADIFIRSVKATLEGQLLPTMETPSATDDSREEDLELSRLASLSPARVCSAAVKVAAGRSETEIVAHPLSRILRYFADGYLVSSRWQVRNIGVKMVGLLKYSERRDVLLAMLDDPTPERLWKRFLGGDFYQVGFIRRNALTALADLGIWDIPLRDCLVRSLTTDPYYEVRAEAAETILRLADRIGASRELSIALQSNLGHRSPEVRWKCLEAVGAVAPGPDSIFRLENLIYHPDWRIRRALLSAVTLMLRRGVVRRGDPILAHLDQLIPTCTDFTPTFPLKRALNELRFGNDSTASAGRVNLTTPSGSDKG